MMAKDFIRSDELAIFDTATFTPGYKKINPNGFAGSPNLVRFINSSTVLVTISYDGYYPYDILPSRSSFTLFLQSNHQLNNNRCLLIKGSVVYISGAAGKGNFYMSAYYQGE